LKLKERGTEVSPLRFGLGLLWTLNFKAMPTSLLWAISLFVSIQTKSLIIRVLAILLCTIAALLGGHLIRHTLAPRARISLASAFSDKINLGALAISGIAFAITLENVSRYSQAARSVRILMVSNFLTVLVVWLFIQVVVVPIRFTTGAGLSAKETFRLALNYITEQRKLLAISLLSLLFGWPIFFFYFLLALTFAQAMTFSSMQSEERVHIGK